MKFTDRPDEAEGPEGGDQSIVSMSQVASRMGRDGFESADLTTSTGRVQAADRIRTGIVEEVQNTSSLEKLSPEKARILLQQIASRIRSDLRLLRYNANVQQLLSLMDLTIVAAPVSSVLSHGTAHAESERFENLRNDLEAFYKLLDRSGIDVSTIAPDFKKLMKARPGKNLLVSILFPFVRGIDRAVKARAADKLKKDFHTALDRALEMVDRVEEEIQRGAEQN